MKTTYYIVYSEEQDKTDIELYYVGTSKDRAKSIYKKEVPYFLGRYPTDRLSFRLVEADLTNEEIKLLRDEFKTGWFTAEVHTLLTSLWFEPSHKEIYSENGLDALIIFYCDQNALYFFDYEDYVNIDAIFINNPGLLKRVIKDYIKATY